MMTSDDDSMAAIRVTHLNATPQKEMQAGWYSKFEVKPNN